MRKILLIFLLIPVAGMCQDTFIEVKHGVDTLYSATGFKVYKGVKLKTGTGTMPDGDFKFIQIAESSFFHKGSITGSGVIRANALPMKYSHLELPVTKIVKKGNVKQGFAYYPVIDNITKYEVDLDNAIATGEIVVPEIYRPKPKDNTAQIIQQPLSIADELAKLKKLKDDGTLTDEEFQAQKKKLLEK